MALSNRPSRVPAYYRKFLSSLESKSLIKVAETVSPFLWCLSEDELSNKFHVSVALEELKEKFWSEASFAWMGGQRLQANKTFSSDHRSYNYWLKVFRNEPAILVWLLKPLEELFYDRKLIQGITSRLHQMLRQPLRTRSGAIRVSDASVMFRVTELYTLWESEFRRNSINSRE